MEIQGIQNQFAYLHQWVKEKYKLTEPTLSQVAASLVQSHVVASGMPITIKTGDPLEIGFISSAADGELHGSLNVNLAFDTSLTLESEE